MTVMEIVIVQLDGSSHTLFVGPQSTVAALKSLIESTLNVPVHLQKLVFVNGIKTPLSDDSKPLSFYGLVSGSHVSLLVTERNTIQVFLRKENGETSTYEVTPDETVDTFKEKVHRREKIPVTQQCLTHNSKVMTEGKLSDYGVKEKSTIDLNLRLRGG